MKTNFTYWVVENEIAKSTVFRAPSTQGGIAVRGTAISFEGNLINITADEQGELPQVLKAVSELHGTRTQEFAKRKAVKERQGEKREADAITEVSSPTDAKTNA